MSRPAIIYYSNAVLYYCETLKTAKYLSAVRIEHYSRLMQMFLNQNYSVFLMIGVNYTFP